ncbi:hypothetical protein [Nocardia sp. NPDC050710]
MSKVTPITDILRQPPPRLAGVLRHHGQMVALRLFRRLLLFRQ